MKFLLISDNKLEKYRFNCIVPALIAGGAAIAGAIIASKGNSKSQQKANETNQQIASDTNAMNMQLNRENIAFQKEENAIARQREDTAYQRAVADAQKAGLSPLGVTQAASSAMTAPSNQLGMQGASVAPVENGFSAAGQALANGFQAYMNLRAQQVDMDYKNAMADNLRADTISKDIANSFDLQSMDDRLASLVLNLDEVTARIDNIKSGTSHYEADTKRLLGELEIAQKKLNAQIANITANTENLHANTANSIANTIKTEIQTQMEQHNLLVAQKLGLPTGMIPSNPTQVGVMAGLQAGDKQGVSSEAKKEHIARSQEAADKQYQIDLQSWYSAMERADKAYRHGEMSASEYRAFQRNNPKPKKSDYKVKKRK